MAGHKMTQHGQVVEARHICKTSDTEELWTYRMAFPSKGGPQRCPVEVCPGRAATRTAMRVHFLQRHVLEIVIILEEGNLPHPRCPRCNMLVPRITLNGRHPCHCTVPQGSGAKEAATSGGGAEGEHGERL